MPWVQGACCADGRGVVGRAVTWTVVRCCWNLHHQNQLRNAKHGVLRCKSCARTYCRVKIRNELLGRCEPPVRACCVWCAAALTPLLPLRLATLSVCSQMRGVFQHTHTLCHCQLNPLGVCPCQACQSRRRRRARKTKRKRSGSDASDSSHTTAGSSASSLSSSSSSAAATAAVATATRLSAPRLAKRARLHLVRERAVIVMRVGCVFVLLCVEHAHCPVLACLGVSHARCLTPPTGRCPVCEGACVLAPACCGGHGCHAP